MPNRDKYILAILFALVAGVLLYMYFGVYKSIPQEETKEIVTPQVASMVRTIGYSTQGRKIEQYTFGSGEHHLVFVGGIHGGYEWNSVVLAYQFIDYLHKDISVIPSNITVTIIPSLNPDGVYKVVGKEGRFDTKDVSTDANVLASGRFNANGVDLNRNFDCKWKSESKWRDRVVSAGSGVFSEPEARAIKNFVENQKPSAIIFWHSQSNAVYASECEGGILEGTKSIMNLYSKASGYPAKNSFTSYEITGDVGDWLATLGIPSISVELKTHETIEFDQNIAGVKALLKYFELK